MKELTIRRLRPTDTEALHALLSDPQVMRYLEPPYDRPQTEQFLREAGLAEPPLVYGAEEDGRLLGYVIYHAYDPAHRAGKTAVIECVPEQTATRHIAEKKGFAYVGRTGGLEVYRLPPNE